LSSKPKLIIAGPGAGKTYGIVEEVIKLIPQLNPNKLLVVTTYTNAATENIRSRLSKKIAIPRNVFIGTMHSFLNKFIVIPFVSHVDKQVQAEKLFIQCGTDDILRETQKGKAKLDPQGAAIVKKRIKESMKKRGYITYDQTISLAHESFKNKKVKAIISNRIQYLLIDEFQDTNNQIFEIVEHIRKQKKTSIYCVGDPEQYIQSFDSSVKTFGNIPILKASRSNSYELILKKENHRSTETICNFLNHFNGRTYKENVFKQDSVSKVIGEAVYYIDAHTEAGNIIPLFMKKCEELKIKSIERCIICKRNEIVKRCAAALKEDFITPDKQNRVSPLAEIKAIFLSSLSTNQTKFCTDHKCDRLDLRKVCLKILKAIKQGIVTDENTYGKYVSEELGYQIKGNVPPRIKNLKIGKSVTKIDEAVQLSNIHIYKGLEADAVLCIAKNNSELELWLETDGDIRETKRTNETTDYPRLGYVAFSRARKLLCIGCLEPMTEKNKKKLTELNVTEL